MSTRMRAGSASVQTSTDRNRALPSSRADRHAHRSAGPFRRRRSSPSPPRAPLRSRSRHPRRARRDRHPRTSAGGGPSMPASAVTGEPSPHATAPATHTSTTSRMAHRTRADRPGCSLAVAALRATIYGHSPGRDASYPVKTRRRQERSPRMSWFLVIVSGLLETGWPTASRPRTASPAPSPRSSPCSA